MLMTLNCDESGLRNVPNLVNPGWNHGCAARRGMKDASAVDLERFLPSSLSRQ